MQKPRVTDFNQGIERKKLRLAVAEKAGEKAKCYKCKTLMFQVLSLSFKLCSRNDKG